MPASPAVLRRLPVPALPLALLALLLAVNGLSAAGIVAAQRAARATALQDLELETQVHARALEASLATLRRDLVALSREAVLRSMVAGAGSLPALGGVAAAENALLLFHQRNPAVRALALRDRQGAPLVLTERRPGEAAVLLPRTSDPPAPIAAGDLFVSQLAVVATGERGLLEVWIAPAELLAVVAPAAGARVELRPDGGALPPVAERHEVRAEVRDARWSPPLHWRLVRGEGESPHLAPVAALAASYRRSVALNVGIILLTVPLAVLAYRQARRGAELAAENRQQARLRELERQVLHAERLASVGRLAAGLAHEVNNPLEGMSNYLTLLEEDLAAGELEAARSLLPRLREGVGRVAGVTRQVLAFSDPGRLAKVPLDLRRPLGEAVDFVRRHPAFAAVTLRLQQPDEPVQVVGSATTLGQLFLNLLLNAAQSQASAGEVEVACRLAPGGRALVAVADRGPGLSVEAQRHLFEPFFSTRGSTGLGLAACHGIARDHEGVLTGGNRAGGGAVFTLELPLSRAERAPADAATCAPSPGVGAASGAAAGTTQQPALPASGVGR